MHADGKNGKVFWLTGAEIHDLVLCLEEIKSRFPGDIVSILKQAKEWKREFRLKDNTIKKEPTP